ncbi:hypothetical protein PWT90_07366 [Aphanocladium album]|nr:hypothetical protein PWT90_07366 [Aphanocladium album]
MSSTEYAGAGVAIATATLLIVAYRDYSAYCALGDHGLPGNFRGWCTQLKLARKSRKDTTVPAPYEVAAVAAETGPHALERFLPPNVALLPRAGSRPQIPGFAAPQRQLTAVASAPLKERMNEHLQVLAAANPTLLQSGVSVLERYGTGVQISKELAAPPSYLRKSRGEIVHVHPPDGSTHLVLSLADSREIIEKGWGQRHRLSGTLLGWGYTLVYAPRNEKEFELWKGIVSAAVGYAAADIVKLGRTNNAMLGHKLSRFDGNSEAIQLTSSVPVSPPLDKTRGGIGHFHLSDGSTHVVLAMPEASEVIEKGWGHKMRIAGSTSVPWGFTLLCAPRDQDELDVWKDIMSAGINYSCADIGKVLYT